jgi:hypothetical protein
MAGSAKKPSKEEVKAMIKYKKEKKKLDALLKKGKISQAAYQRRLQKIAPKGLQTPGMAPAPPGGAVMPPQMAPMPGGPPQPMPPGQQAVPQVPITPAAHEEIPKVGKPLAISSNDIEVVECHQCGGLITVTAPQRPVIVECPSCGAKGELEKEEEEDLGPSKPITATEAEFASPTFHLTGDESTEKPEFGPSLKEDEAKEDTPQPEAEAPKVEKDEPVYVEHERPSTVEYDESMYATQETPTSYDDDHLSKSTIMDFGSAKVEGEEGEPKPEVKTPTVTPTVSEETTPKPSVTPTLKPTLKPKVKKEEDE